MSGSSFHFLARDRRPGRTAVPWLVFECPLSAGLGWPAAVALLDRLPTTGPPATVILDLAGSDRIAEEECAALCWLHGRLVQAGSRLWLATPGRFGQLLADRGVTGTLGAGAIHPSRRAAVLAVFAAQPGPGLVTSSVKSALAEPPLRLLPAAPAPAVPPLPRQRTAGRRAAPPARHPARRPARRLLPLLHSR